MRKLLFSLTLLVSFTLTACSTIVNNIPGVYTLEIQQGNMIDQDMINQLKPNMTKRQVLYIMGTPMLMDAFHQKRWDYLYSKRVDGDTQEQKRVSLFFEGDILTGVQGDFRPDSQATKSVKETTVDVPARDLEKTLWEMVTGLFSSKPERKVVEETGEVGEKSAVTSTAVESKADENTKKENSSATPINPTPAAQ